MNGTFDAGLLNEVFGLPDIGSDDVDAIREHMIAKGVRCGDSRDLVLAPFTPLVRPSSGLASRVSTPWAKQNLPARALKKQQTRDSANVATGTYDPAPADLLPF